MSAPRRFDAMATADELRAHATVWEPDVRVLGNVTARDVLRVCDALSDAFDRLLQLDDWQRRAEAAEAKLRSLSWAQSIGAPPTSMLTASATHCREGLCGVSCECDCPACAPDARLAYLVERWDGVMARLAKGPQADVPAEQIAAEWEAAARTLRADLAAAGKLVREARVAALEEAALVCDDEARQWLSAHVEQAHRSTAMGCAAGAGNCATRIRALKGGGRV